MQTTHALCCIFSSSSFFVPPKLPFKNVKNILSSEMTIQKQTAGWPGLGYSLQILNLQHVRYEGYYNNARYLMLQVTKNNFQLVFIMLIAVLLLHIVERTWSIILQWHLFTISNFLRPYRVGFWDIYLYTLYLKNFHSHLECADAPFSSKIK